MRYIFILLGCIIGCASCAQNDGSGLAPVVEQHTYQLRNTIVKISVHQYLPRSGFTFIILHDNEFTAETACKEILEQCGGTLVSLENNESRNLSFQLNRKTYRFDPNRMFTKAGIKNSLETFGSYSTAAAKEIEKFAVFVLKKIPDSGMVVAVHNNTDNEYSILDYEQQGRLAKEAAAVHRNALMDDDDFVFTTATEVFHYFKEHNMNVVLQKNNDATDDGSLSVLYGRQNKRYTNIEAEHEHKDIQVKMIEALYPLFSKF